MNRFEPEYAIVENDAEELNVEAKVESRKIGYAWCERRDDRLNICDLCVDDKFRRCGIGTKLLRLILDAADSAGVQEVWGIVTAKDIGNWPGVLAWYEKHGFAVTEPDAECIPTAVNKIVRRR